MELVEKVEIRKLKFIQSLTVTDFYDYGISNKCKTKRDQKEQYDRVQSYISRMLNVRGEMKHIYKYTLNTNADIGGRLFSGSSIQTCSSVIRGLLFGDTTTDIDCANCHPKILRYICKKHKILCPQLDYYCNNRDEVLDIGNNRDETKILILKMVNDDKVNRNLNGFLKDLDKECKAIQLLITKEPEYAELLQTIPAHRVYNWYGSAINRILCKYENNIIQEVLHVCNKNNIEITALMFDGIMINGDYYNNLELIEEIENHTENKFFGLNMKMTYKLHNRTLIIPDEWVEPDDKLTHEESKKKNPMPDGSLDYEGMKHKFEVDMGACKILKKSMFLLTLDRMFESKDDIEGDVSVLSDYIVSMKESDLKTSFKHLSFKEMIKKGEKWEWVDVPFLTRWLSDTKMKIYIDVGVYPPPLKCPDHIYNFWEDWNITKYNDYKYENKDVEVAQFLEHIKILCGNHDETFNYICMWIAQMFQYPATKSICPTFISREGGGKGTLIKLLRLLMGDRKVIETTNPSRDCWGDFNSIMQTGFLINLNELSKKETISSEGKIKGLITDDTMCINKKNTPQHMIKSYHRFIITTNNEEPVTTKKDDRRNLIIRSSDEKCGNKQYFNNLYNLLKDKDVLMSMYKHFMNVDIYPDLENFGDIPIPKTPYQKELQKLSIDTIETFIKIKAEKNMGSSFIDNEQVIYYENIPMEDLYILFNIWKNENNYEYNCNYQKFCVRLHRLNINGITKGNHTRDGNIIKLDYKIINKEYLDEETFNQQYEKLDTKENVF